MFKPSRYNVSPPRPATVLLVDLRNFTPNLNAAEADEEGISHFCHFLSQFYAISLDSCLVALPRTVRAAPPLYISSTGDGVLVVLHHENHVRYGFLATLILHTVLEVICDHYNRTRRSRACPTTSFGIGVESGEVCQVRAFPDSSGGVPLVDTYIGECINVAARAEAASKLYHRSNTIIAEGTNELLSESLFGESYATLIQTAMQEDIDDSARLAAQDRMNEINRTLCITFMHHHNLKGVDRPTPLFRLAHGAAQPGNPRFDALMGRLAEDEPHFQEIVAYLRDSCCRFRSRAEGGASGRNAEQSA